MTTPTLPAWSADAMKRLTAQPLPRDVAGMLGAAAAGQYAALRPRAVVLLLTLRARQWAGMPTHKLADLATAAGMARSTAFRAVRDLRRAGIDVGVHW